MKRKGNLYQNICEYTNIEDAFDEVCRNTKNKNKVAGFKEYKCIYISRIHKMLKNEEYKPGPYNIFIIHDPKTRRIVSQNMVDKVVNHLVSRNILYPAILPCLLDVNVASRKDLGTSEGLRLAKDFHRQCKIKYKKYYILKFDISKFFASIDHEILMNKVKIKIKDQKSIKIIEDIINTEPTGISIGAMTSQVLAIFYLNDLDHFIKEDLKIKYYIRYQDDGLLFHPSKEYLKYCLHKIEEFLANEKLTLNRKTRIYSNNNNFIFLGRNSKGKYVKYRNIKRKLKKRYYLYKQNLIPLNSLVTSYICYKGLCERDFKFLKSAPHTSPINITGHTQP